MLRLFPLLSILIVLGLIAGGFFYGWPQFQEFRSLQNELESKEKALEQKEEHFTEFRDLETKLADYEEELSKIDAALPLELSMPVVFQMLEDAAVMGGVLLESTGVDAVQAEKTEHEGADRITFSSTIRGSYTSFKDFLRALHNNPRFFDVQSVQLATPDEETSLFNVSIQLATYAATPFVSSDDDDEEEEEELFLEEETP